MNGERRLRGGALIGGDLLGVGKDFPEEEERLKTEKQKVKVIREPFSASQTSPCHRHRPSPSPEQHRMGDETLRYPVALRWDQGSKELKKVKNALQKYFLSPKQSKGGECEIRDTDCTPGYTTIYFKEKEVQQRILKKNSHEVPFQDKTLLVHASLPDAENAQNMGGAFCSSIASSDDETSGSSADKDRQQEGNRKRENSSMTNPNFDNGDPKRLDWKDGDDSTRHRELVKGRIHVGAHGREEQDNDSSTPRSLEDNNPEGSTIPGDESRRPLLNKERKIYSAAPPEDDGTSGASADKEQEPNRSADFPRREQSSLTDSGLMHRGTGRPSGDPTRNREDHRSDGGTDGNKEIDPSAPRPMRENGEKSGGDSFAARNESGGNLMSHPKRTEEPGRNHPTFTQEPFISVTASLDKKRFTEALQKEIEAEFPSLRLENKSDVVNVTGTYREIELVYRHLRGGWEKELGAERTPETSRDWSSTNISADHVVCFPSALYEYIMEIHRTEMDTLESRYGVKIDPRSTPEGSTYVTFIPRGSGSSPEKAQEIFTNKVQKVMDDWSQVTVDPSVVPLTIPEIKERVMDRWSNTLVIRGENKDIVLRGPRDELSRVKAFLEATDHKPARPRGAVTISPWNMKTEIEVDARHMDILKKLKPRQISDIEKKYNVNIEEKKKNGSLVVTFKSANGAPDLSPHASHSFITLLQKTFFNIQKKEISVKPEIQEDSVNIVQEQLTMAGIDIVMEYSTGTVLLIGHPIHVAFAEERLGGSQNPGRSQAAGASEEETDTSSPSAATPKAEEPDKCPICLNEIEDKEILEKCKHAYCKDCLKQAMAHKPVCPICGVSYGTVTGDQPDGTMSVHTNQHHLPGYPGCGTIEIYYNIPGGVQKENHPHPGRRFSGTSRTAYLPDNREGKDILVLLRKAFNQKLTFTVGESRTTGATDTVTWNDIHHKTSTTGGPQCFGYPDPDYLKRVRDELKAKGIE